MYKDSLVRRMKALIAFRLLVVTILLGTIYVFGIGGEYFPYPKQLNYLIILLYTLNLFYAVLLLRVRHIFFAYAQFLLDVVSTVALILLTGGIGSWFSSLLLLIVTSSVIVAGKQAGYVTAAFGSLLYGLVIDLQFYNIIPVPYEATLREKDFFYNIFSHILAMFLTASLAGNLYGRLERATRRFEKKDIDYRELAIFNNEVIESIPSGIFTTDMSGRTLLFNRAASEIVGIDTSAAIGMDIETILPFVGFVGEKDHVEGILTRSGQNRIIGLKISKLKGTGGIDKGYIGIFEDLTEMKTLQEEMRQREKLADIGELSANMAHEIRNPIASLKGSIELLKEDTLSPLHKARLMDIALSEMNRLNKIITDFLIYSRPKPIETRKFDLNELLEETIEMLRHREADKVEFEKRFNGHLTVVADPQKLQQVFLNLGINAVDAMKDGGKLTVATQRIGNTVTVSFEDTGDGIDAENLKKIYYPFFTTKDNGTGLGLSIAYRIIEDHGGQMTVSSRKGHGARFKIFLPQATVEEGED